MLRRLLPRRETFFQLFSRHAALCVQGAELLRTQIRELRAAGAEERAGRVHAVEHEADAVCQETVERVHSTFVTPIERGDIHDLASRLDDIMDHIEAVSQRLWLYEIQQPTPEIGDMAGNLVDAVKAMKVMVDALAETRDPERMRALSTAVKAVEKSNDRLLRRATARLFKEEQDPKTLIKWKEVYENVEDAIDRCEDVANLIEGVALENA